MATKIQTVLFAPSDLGEIAALLRSLQDDKAGWINITPANMDAPKPTSVWGRINGRGPEVPRLTWTAPTLKGRKTNPAQVGLEHPGGTKALGQLAEANHPLPSGWQRLQDHPMRGLVVVPPVDALAEDILAWALKAACLLGKLEEPSRWRAEVWR